MSDVVLSAAVRQNLLSLQSTTQLLATTQNDLATGNKVNSALDNPTNYFTAQSLNSRASDISNLLDSVGNGVQVLQAANTGITSLQTLLSSAKSIANQALQQTSGYSTKSQFVSTAITGATANNLLGTGNSDATVTGTSLQNNTTGALFNNTVTGSEVVDDHLTGTTDGASISATTTATTPATLTGSSDISGSLSTNFAAGDSFDITVGSTTKTFTFFDSAASGTDPTAGNVVGVDLNGTTNTSTALLSAINGATGFNGAVASLSSGNDLVLTATNTTDSVSLSSGVTTALGFGTGTTVTDAPASTPTAATVDATTLLSGTTSNAGGALSGISSGDSFTVNGKTISFGTAATSLSATGGTIKLSTGTVQDVLDAINGVAGAGTASVVNGKLEINANASGADVTLDNGTNTPLASLGITGPLTVQQTTATSTTDITGASLLSGTATSTSTNLGTSIAAGNSISVNGKTINFTSTGGTSTTSAGGSIDLTTGSVQDVLDAIDKITGTYGTSNASTISGGKISLSTGSANLVLADGTGTALENLGLQAGTNSANSGAAAAISGTTSLNQTASATSNGLTTSFSASDSITVNGKTINFSNSASTSTNAGGGTINLSTGSVQDVLDAIDKVTGTYGTANASTIGSDGAIQLHTGSTSDLTISGSGLSKLGLTSGTTQRDNLGGKELTIGAVDGGTATDITFGTGTGQISTLDELNSALAANNLEASLSSAGALTITTTNDHASSSVGAIGGTAVSDANSPFSAATVSGPVANTDVQNSRAALVSQYNTIMDQIKTTAQDSSLNGVNLLNGDQLKLVFNETGTSTLNIQGNTDDPAGLGLSNLVGGSDFLDNASTNKVLDSLTQASNTLQSQASTLGSNLSVVETRQTFSQSMINVLQTAASNLTLADPNVEAANSQALSTRQSIAVSALALANSSQQSVLRLLQ